MPEHQWVRYGFSLGDGWELFQMPYGKMKPGWRKKQRESITQKRSGRMGGSAGVSDQRTLLVRNQIIVFLSKSNGPFWGTDRWDKASRVILSPFWVVCLCESQINSSRTEGIRWAQWITPAFCEKNEVKKMWIKITRSARSNKCSNIPTIFPKCFLQKQFAE